MCRPGRGPEGGREVGGGGEKRMDESGERQMCEKGEEEERKETCRVEEI